ncbi:MFS transporter [Leekyejoonella antrihumi]|nr:MFS transporter [Leekyejoonella antrihumi]
MTDDGDQVTDALTDTTATSNTPPTSAEDVEIPSVTIEHTERKTATAHSKSVPMFAALKEYNYRLYFTGQVISNTGTWMQRIAQDWLVLQLTNSPFAVGITTALQFLPVLLFGVLGGLAIDRFPKRTILVVTQAIMGALATVLAVLTLTGAVTVWHVDAVAFALGLVTVVDNPTRQVFVNEMVSPRLVRNAVSLNTATFQLARLVGPAVAGLLIAATGSGIAFAINAASYAATIVALLAMRKDLLHHLPLASRERGQLREGFRYVAARPQILWIIVMVFFIGTFGYNFSVFLSAYAKDTFHTSASVYGLLNTALAIGSLLGAALAARRSSARLGFLFAVAAAFSGLMIVLSVTPWLLAFMALLAVCGLASTSFSTTANASVQLASDPKVRGRVMSLYMMVFMGGTPVGGPVSGWLADRFGAPAAMMICGGICLIATIVSALIAAHQSGIRPRLDLHTHVDRHLVLVRR